MGDLLSELRAQPTALVTLEGALAARRVHHAYLFTGPAGVGKELAAFALAQALVCERRESREQNAHGRACGACPACARALPREETRRPVHPDIVVIERGLYPPATIGRRTPESQEISIDQIRTLVLARSGYAPHEGHAKVFIVRRAEELSTSAANALLKTLEEPPKATHFILLTDQPDSLLPTILSRTLRVRFTPLPEAVLAALLEARGVTGDRAVEIARISGGSLEAAMTIADPDESEAREKFVARALEAVRAPTIEPALALAEEVKKDKERLATWLATLASALAKMAGDDLRVAGSDAESLAVRGGHALTALEHLAGNGAPQLVVEAMLLRMRAA